MHQSDQHLLAMMICHPIDLVNSLCISEQFAHSGTCTISPDRSVLESEKSTHVAQ